MRPIRDRVASRTSPLRACSFAWERKVALRKTLPLGSRKHTAATFATADADLRTSVGRWPTRHRIGDALGALHVRQPLHTSSTSLQWAAKRAVERVPAARELLRRVLFPEGGRPRLLAAGMLKRLIRHYRGLIRNVDLATIGTPLHRATALLGTRSSRNPSPCVVALARKIAFAGSIQKGTSALRPVTSPGPVILVGLRRKDLDVWPRSKTATTRALGHATFLELLCDAPASRCIRLTWRDRLSVSLGRHTRTSVAHHTRHR